MSNFAKNSFKAASIIALIAMLGANLAACSSTAVASSNGSDFKELNPKDFDCPVPKYDEYGYSNNKAIKSAPMVGMGYYPPPTSPVPVIFAEKSAPPPPPPPPPPAPPPPLVERKTQVKTNLVVDTPVQRAVTEKEATPNVGAADSIVVTGSKATGYPNPVVYPNKPDEFEKYPHYQINGVKQTATEPVSTFAMETDTASYSTARRTINDGSLPANDSIRVEEFLNYFKYNYQLPKDKSAPFSTNVSIVPSPWNEDKKIIHIGLQGYKIDPENRPPLNIVFLLDVSGSMQSEDKLPLAKRSIRALASSLNANDHVSMVVYAGASGTVLKPTKGDNKKAIVCALEALEAGGSTAGAEGIELAYKTAKMNFKKDAINRVVLMTDGDFNVGIDDPDALEDLIEQKRKEGVYLSVLGFGDGNYRDDMMQALAQKGNGIAAYIDTFAEAKKVLYDEFTSSMFPIANDVKAQIEFNPAQVSQYRLIGYETRKLNQEDFNNDKIDAGEIGAGHQVTALYEITLKGAKSDIDPLRYQEAKAPIEDKGSELGYLKLRYKLPGSNVSKLIERPLTKSDMVSNINNAKPSTKLALAVAGFAQLLRNDPWIGKFGFDDVINLGEAATEDDAFGYSQEFLDLVKEAKSNSKE